MRYYKRLKIYKSSNGNNTFSPDSLTAYSYGWWLYFTRHKGKLVFNNTYYSNSTTKHQSKLRRVLNDLNIKPDIVIQNSKASLNNMQAVRKDLRLEVKELIRLIKKPRTRKSTNAERLKRIKYLRQLHTELV